VLINYDSHQPLKQSIGQVIKQLPTTDDEIIIIGHSLGGVIATLITDIHPRVSNLVTISSPLAGSKAANIVRWLPGHPSVMSDITPSSEFIQFIRDYKPTDIPALSIISTGGHLKTTPEPNDSVVTLSSQRALRFGKKAEVKASHFEVLMHEKTVDLIRNHVFGEQE
jgi:pimeloyl-ACP methyl ester carboxylesterase